MKKAYIDVPPDSTGRVNAKPARVRPHRINHACRPGSVRNRSRVSKRIGAVGAEDVATELRKVVALQLH
jgi:hypothetical protein